MPRFFMEKLMKLSNQAKSQNIYLHRDSLKIFFILYTMCLQKSRKETQVGKYIIKH